jgi:hypothetical protein
MAIRACGLALCAGAIVLAVMIYEGVTNSLRAEENLHATLFTIRLVEQFVAEHRRWPASWSELEELNVPVDAPQPANRELAVVRIGGSHGYRWPDASPHLQQCVAVDFHADPGSIAREDPSDFRAIKPIGPYFPYLKYGFVESLQETIAAAMPTEADRP